MFVENEERLEIMYQRNNARERRLVRVDNVPVVLATWIDGKLWNRSELARQFLTPVHSFSFTFVVPNT